MFRTPLKRAMLYVAMGLACAPWFWGEMDARVLYSFAGATLFLALKPAPVEEEAVRQPVH